MGKDDRRCKAGRTACEVRPHHSSRERQLPQSDACGACEIARRSLTEPECHWGTFARPSCRVFFSSMRAVQAATCRSQMKKNRHMAGSFAAFGSLQCGH